MHSVFLLQVTALLCDAHIFWGEIMMCIILFFGHLGDSRFLPTQDYWFLKRYLFEGGKKISDKPPLSLNLGTILIFIRDVSGSPLMQEAEN